LFSSSNRNMRRKMDFKTTSTGLYEFLDNSSNGNAEIVKPE
jgi:hypothetical protein